MRFTVFTPTYNRAHTLQRVYESLKAQTLRDFEWLIVDDGSNDETATLVASWAPEAGFPIRYEWQANGGKHTAINRGAEMAAGTLFLVLDSDDWCVGDALERFWHHWVSIPEAERAGYAGVGVLCQDPQGRLIGDRFPADCFDSTPIELRSRYGIQGDKWELIRTDLLRAHPFPRFEGERFVTEAYVWDQVALTHKTRYVNEALKIVEYRPDGLTASILKLRVANPVGLRMYYRQAMGYPVSPAARVRAGINYVRFSCHAGVGWAATLKEARQPALAAVCYPIGYMAHLIDRKKLHRE